MFTTEIQAHFHYLISLLSVLTPKWLEKRRFTFYHTRKLSLKNFSFLSGNLLLLHSLYFLHSGLWRYMFHFVINCCLNTYHFMSRRKISEAYLYVWLPGKLFWEQQLLQIFFFYRKITNKIALICEASLHKSLMKLMRTVCSWSAWCGWYRSHRTVNNSALGSSLLHKKYWAV